MTFGDFTEWLRNGRPPWSAYRAMMSVQLIALDKQPGIIPVGVGKTRRWMMAKCLLQGTSQEAKAACGTEQLDWGVEERIEGGIHAMCILWEEQSREEEWGFLLIDVWNTFNEEK